MIETKSILDDIINKFVELLSVGNIFDSVRSTIRNSYSAGMDEVETQFNMNFFQDTEKIEFLEKYAFDNIKGMNDEIAEKLRKELSQGLMNLESIPDLQKRVRKVMDVSVERARTIAITEANRAENMGSLDAAKQAGIKLKKQWSAQRERVSRAGNQVPCPYCEFMDGQMVPLHANFRDQNGMTFQTPPHHPNCACTLVYVQPTK